jgi:hypothetical protein
MAFSRGENKGVLSTVLSTDARKPKSIARAELFQPLANANWRRYGIANIDP